MFWTTPRALVADCAGRALPYFRTERMLNPMKTTLVIPDPLFSRLKRAAAAQDRTLSELVEDALVTFLERRPATKRRKSLPAFNLGTPRVDLADRDALYALMETGDVRR
jgi:hypothetical protein